MIRWRPVGVYPVAQAEQLQAQTVLAGAGVLLQKTGLHQGGHQAEGRGFGQLRFFCDLGDPQLVLVLKAL